MNRDRFWASQAPATGDATRTALRRNGRQSALENQEGDIARSHLEPPRRVNTTCQSSAGAAQGRTLSFIILRPRRSVRTPQLEQSCSGNQAREVQDT